jgi:hypothetical protein
MNDKNRGRLLVEAQDEHDRRLGAAVREAIQGLSIYDLYAHCLRTKPDLCADLCDVLAKILQEEGQ